MVSLNDANYAIRDTAAKSRIEFDLSHASQIIFVPEKHELVFNVPEFSENRE